jgi:hypothetical protein
VTDPETPPSDAAMFTVRWREDGVPIECDLALVKVHEVGSFTFLFDVAGLAVVLPTHSIESVYREDVSGDDDEGGGGGAPDPDDPDPTDPEPPDLDGLAVQVDGTGVISLVTDTGPSGVIGARDDLAIRRAAQAGRDRRAAERAA